MNLKKTPRSLKTAAFLARARRIWQKAGKVGISWRVLENLAKGEGVQEHLGKPLKAQSKLLEAAKILEKGWDAEMLDCWHGMLACGDAFMLGLLQCWDAGMLGQFGAFFPGWPHISPTSLKVQVNSQKTWENVEKLAKARIFAGFLKNQRK